MQKKLTRAEAKDNLNISDIFKKSNFVFLEENERDDEEEEVLNDYEWYQKRVKIGLTTRNTKRFDKRVKQTEDERQQSVKFYQEFKRKECIRFVPKAGQDDQEDPVCHCGANELKHWHIERERIIKRNDLITATVNELKPPSPANSLISRTRRRRKTSTPVYVLSPPDGVSLDEEVNSIISNDTLIVNDLDRGEEPEEPKVPSWIEENDIQEFDTNAFGMIDFINEDEGSGKPARYLRLSDQSPMDRVKELLRDHWHFFKPKKPQLAICIIGGGTNFHMEGKYRELFKSGLTIAARSTNALIVTTGLNMGAVKLVGEAVSEAQYLVPDGPSHLRRAIKLLGIANWGLTRNVEDLINIKPNVLNRSHYYSHMGMRNGDVFPINGDHTNFLFVDDGHRTKWEQSYNNFVSRFISMLRDKDQHGMDIPVVTILLEGGLAAIRILKERLLEGIAVVVIQSSGRAADLIAYASMNCRKDPEKGYTLKEGHITQLKEGLDFAFDMEWETQEEKAEGLKSALNMILECVRYNNLIIPFDIANEIHLSQKILEALLTSQEMSKAHILELAMVWDRQDIAELHIFNDGVNVISQLKSENKLDNIVMKALQLQRVKFIEPFIHYGFAFRDFLTVQRLALLYDEESSNFGPLKKHLGKLCGINTDKIYLNHIHQLFIAIFKDHQHETYKEHMNENSPNNFSTFDEPYLELFLWAVLTNKWILVDYFWPRLQTPLLGALIAGSICSKLAHVNKADKSSDYKGLSARKIKFQSIASEIIEKAFLNDQSKAFSLLDLRNPRWGDKNLLNISHIGYLRAFVANPYCQLYTKKEWRRGFVRLHPLTSMIGLFIPMIVWTPLVEFQPGLGDDGGSLNPFQKILTFYKCPIVKYTGMCISFVVFLLLYSFVVLFQYRWEYQISEIVLYGWFIILGISEIRELFTEPSRTLKGKCKDYIRSIWNRWDCLCLTISIIAFIMRNFEVTFWISRILMAYNCAFYYVRMFRIFHASTNLGPKLVVFHKMIPQIITFIALLIVFIFAYGIGSQAMIDPYRELTFENVGNLWNEAIMQPYWQMFGDLSLDKIQVKNYEECQADDPRQVCGEAPDKDHFTHMNAFLPIFLAIYMLVGNVMLLNLLIAIFTSVFDEVNRNSNEIWKWEMYRLLVDYDSRPILPPPLIIFEIVWDMIKGCGAKLICCKQRVNHEVEDYIRETIQNLDFFEKDCTKLYLAKEKQQKVGTNDRRLKHVEEMIETLTEHTKYSFYEGNNTGEDIRLDHKLYHSSDEDDEQNAQEEERETRKKKRHNTITSYDIRQGIFEMRDQLDRVQYQSSNALRHLGKRINKIEDLMKDLKK